MSKFRFDRWGHRIHEDIKEIKLKIGKTYQFENWNKKEKGVKFTAEVIAEYKKYYLLQCKNYQTTLHKFAEDYIIEETKT